jgi:prepilin peptidase CpaA
VIWEWVSVFVLAGVLIAAAVCDLRQGKVFNRLTYPAILVGLALGVAQGAAAGQMRDVLVNHVMGFGFGFGVLFIAYLLGGMGGGDVKLMAAVGAFVGWPGALDAVFYSFLVAAAVGVIVVIWRGETRVVLRRLWLAVRILPLPTARMEEAVPTSTRLVPFGFAVCVGTLWFLVEDRAGVSLWDAVSRGLDGLARLTHLWK